MHTAAINLSASLLAWFACLSAGSKLALSIDYYDLRRTRRHGRAFNRKQNCINRLIEQGVD